MHVSRRSGAWWLPVRIDDFDTSQASRTACELRSYAPHGLRLGEELPDGALLIGHVCDLPAARCSR